MGATASTVISVLVDIVQGKEDVKGRMGFGAGKSDRLDLDFGALGVHGTPPVLSV